MTPDVGKVCHLVKQPACQQKILELHAYDILAGKQKYLAPLIDSVQHTDVLRFNFLNQSQQ